MAQHVVGKVAEIGPGQRKIVTVEGISIGVFNVGGTYYALRNRCPHQGAPLCQGSVKGTALPSSPIRTSTVPSSAAMIRSMWLAG